MGEKSKFQKGLERLASKQIIATILIGCLFFCVAIIGNSKLEQNMKREQHLAAMTEIFDEIYQSTAEFLENEENTEIFLDCLKETESGNRIKYQVSKFNLYAPVGIHVMLSDAEGNVVYTSFSEDFLNLHRLEFNQIADKNAKAGRKKLYSTVYYLSGDTSEYVLIRPIYEDGIYQGSVSAYLKGEDWGRHFLKYQYDTILTDTNGDVIYCSNTSFLSGLAANKYRLESGKDYQWINDSRYLVSRRYLSEHEIYLYSFIYAPQNYSNVVIGILTILTLGILWSAMFYHLLRMMAEKTSQSVRLLVEQIRIVRKENPEYVIQIETGDEIEEIADQINKMVASIHELNQKNMDLLYINNQMEVRNLQAQIKPHFIYNTLDNIRFLIMQDAKKADEMIGHFTHILRYSINNTKQHTFLLEDLEYIEDYLVIQKTRFGERFQYEMSVAPECSRVMIPKLLLQPLIENSLKYGFQKQASLKMWIRGWMEEDYLVLQVEDDGPGQSGEQLERLRQSLQAERIHTEHIGLRNINRRIILEYGKESGLSLDSREGEGFTVTLRLWIGGRSECTV